MQSSKTVRSVCKALGVHISSAAISIFFLLFLVRLIFISADKQKLIHECQRVLVSMATVWIVFFMFQSVHVVCEKVLDDSEVFIRDLCLSNNNKSTWGLFL